MAIPIMIAAFAGFLTGYFAGFVSVVVMVKTKVDSDFEAHNGEEN